MVCRPGADPAHPAQSPLSLCLYNPGMPQLDILLPFSFPSPELAADLLRADRKSVV